MLSDKTIFSLCDIDAKIFDADLYEFLKFKMFTDMRQESCNTNPDSYYLGIPAEARAKAMRLRTEEEREAFVPMIAPFSTSLLRMITQKYSETPPVYYQDKELPMPQRTRDVPIISRGLTSYGYDVSLADDFKVFSNIHSAVIDPKRLDPRCLVDVVAQEDPHTGERYVLMPPNSYLLGRTEEYFCIPRDIMVMCVGKSTYARSGAIVNVTPIEAGFEGNVVIEISNSTNLPARVYAGEGISQFLFFRGDQPCEVSYGDRKGKYQGQTGLTLPKV